MAFSPQYAPIVVLLFLGSALAVMLAAGPPERAATASGMFRVVSLRTWSDESTTSSRRAREIPLYPNPRQAYVVDAAGGSCSICPPTSASRVSTSGIRISVPRS